MPRNPRGFTLIELLVVVAVISLLMVILLPSLALARQQSRTMTCASNMRSAGQIMRIYAGMHDGRGPGNGSKDLGDGSTPIDWGDILNNEIYDVYTGGLLFSSPDAVFYGACELQQTTSFDPFVHARARRLLICPDFQCRYNWDRCYALNRDAAGGAGYSIPGKYGLVGDPRTGPNPSFYTTYAYGAKLDRFGTDQLWLLDTQWDFWVPTYSGYAKFDATHRNLPGGICVLNDTPGDSYYSFPPYTSHAGEIAFRHPYGKSGNFLFFDGHVSLLTPTDNIDTNTRFFIDGIYDYESPHGQ